MTNKPPMGQNGTEKWNGFTKYFSIIDNKDAITSENYLDVIQMYREANREKIVVRHMYYNGKAKIKTFGIGCDGALISLSVWRESGGYGCWDPSLVKLADRPKKKRNKAKPKPKPKRVVATKPKKRPTKPRKQLESCQTHPKYKAIRSPRTACKTCLALYYVKHPDKK